MKVERYGAPASEHKPDGVWVVEEHATKKPLHVFLSRKCAEMYKGVPAKDENDVVRYVRAPTA